jgi:hypothetical protein
MRVLLTIIALCFTDTGGEVIAFFCGVLIWYGAGR